MNQSKKQLRYFKIHDEGLHKDLGNDPTYWVEVNEQGNAERQLEIYSNGTAISYDQTHLEDKYGALSIMVIDGDEEYWIPHEISQFEFETKWHKHMPANRQRPIIKSNLLEFLTIGQVFSVWRKFTQSDFDAFAQLSKDYNPIHVDPAFAAQTRFGRTVAHGMFLYSTICGVLSRHFPGAIQLEQQFMFPAPTYADEPMEIRLQIKEKSEQRLVILTQILNEAGNLTCDGECVLAYD